MQSQVVASNNEEFSTMSTSEQSSSPFKNGHSVEINLKHDEIDLNATSERDLIYEELFGEIQTPATNGNEKKEKKRKPCPKSRKHKGGVADVTPEVVEVVDTIDDESALFEPVGELESKENGLNDFSNTSVEGIVSSEETEQIEEVNFVQNDVQILETDTSAEESDPTIPIVTFPELGIPEVSKPSLEDIEEVDDDEDSPLSLLSQRVEQKPEDKMIAEPILRDVSHLNSPSNYSPRNTYFGSISSRRALHSNPSTPQINVEQSGSFLSFLRSPMTETLSVKRKATELFEDHESKKVKVELKSPGFFARLASPVMNRFRAPVLSSTPVSKEEEDELALDAGDVSIIDVEGDSENVIHGTEEHPAEPALPVADPTNKTWCILM